MTRCNLSPRAPRSGLSLLEVILALAILGGSLAILGNALQTGARAARKSRGRLAAQLQCRSVLEEIVAGIRLPEPMSATPVEWPDAEYDWLYTIEAEPTDRDGLLVVRVTVFENKPPEQGPIRVSLVRWVIDPQFAAEAANSTAGTTTGDTARSGALGAGSSGSRSSGSGGGP